MTDAKKTTRRTAIGAGLSLAAAGGAVLTATPAAAAPTVRVMSWNIHGESVNIAGIASVIRQYGVDVATLQEIHRREDQDQVAALASSLGFHISNNVHFGPSDRVGPCDAPWTGSRAGWAGNAVFSRYPIVERVTKPLSPESQNCPVKRAMSGVRLNADGKVLRVFTTHFTPGATEAALNLRHAQTTTVVNYLSQSGALLLTGDLNDTPVSWVRNRIVDAGFVDAGGRYADDPTLGTARIDYIFYRGTTVSGGFVPSPGLSDHRPVIMDVVL